MNFLDQGDALHPDYEENHQPHANIDGFLRMMATPDNGRSYRRDYRYLTKLEAIAQLQTLINTDHHIHRDTIQSDMEENCKYFNFIINSHIMDSFSQSAKGFTDTTFKSPNILHNFTMYARNKTVTPFTQLTHLNVNESLIAKIPSTHAPSDNYLNYTEINTVSHETKHIKLECQHSHGQGIIGTNHYKAQGFTCNEGFYDVSKDRNISINSRFPTERIGAYSPFRVNITRKPNESNYSLAEANRHALETEYFCIFDFSRQFGFHKPLATKENILLRVYSNKVDFTTTNE